MTTNHEERHFRIDFFKTRTSSGKWTNKKAVKNAHKLYDTMVENSIPKPGIFGGEEEGDVRFEWSSPEEVTVVECSNNGGYWYFYVNEEADITHELETQEEVIALLART